MKSALITLFLTCLALWAQTPAAPPVPAQVPAIPQPAPGSGSGPVTIPSRSIPLPAPARDSNSIVVPNAPAPAAGTAAGGADTNTVAITPSPAAADSAAEDIIPAGMIDFRGLDLHQVLTVYAELVNRTILRPANLTSAPIWLTTRTALTKREAVQALDAVLGLNQITMINVGEKFVKAVPQAGANQEGAPFNKLPSGQLPELGQYVTHVVQLKYAKPSEIVQALQPFSKIPNAILPIDSSQILVLRDYTENVKRMLELVREVDVSIPSEFVQEVIPIKYAQASEIAGALNSLSSGGGGATVGGGGATAGGTAGGGSFGRSMMGGSRSSSFGRGGTMGGYGRSGGYGGMSGGYGGYGGGYGGYTPYGEVTPMGTATPGTTPAAAGSSFTDRLRNIINRAGGGAEDFQVLGQTKILADERTNSLLIYASKEDMKIIKDIVSKLDVVLAQVLIEAVIIQVTLTDNTDIGFNYLMRRGQGNDYFNSIGALKTGNLLNRGAFTAVTNTGTLLPDGFSYLASFGQDLDVTVSALAGNSRAKILQRPRLQTSHNEPATLFIGESRPYPTGSYYGGGSFGGYSSIQQLPIGVSLSIIPLINPDGLVVMQIEQSVDSVNGSVIIANVGEVPITSQKQASTKVSVRDRDTIILGGLIEDSRSKSVSGVPLLKDIPLLGFFFRSNSDQGARNELMILIRPTVLPTPEVAALAARKEKEDMPLIKQYEAETKAEDAKRIEKTEKQMMKDGLR